MKSAVRITQFLIGALFIFSGFIKAVDPLGTSYKMHDYFTAFQSDWPAFTWLWAFMTDTSTFWAVFMLVFELALGFALIAGWKPKLTLWLLLGLMVAFTFLTGYTYLSGFTVDKWYNPASWTFHAKDMKVTDCGCFGDFIKLKPYTSFWKDVVLVGILLFLFAGIRHMYSLVKGRSGNIIMGAATVGSLWFCFSNYLWGLPMIDFRPYAVGDNIRNNMQLPPNAVTDSVAMVFIYEHEGEKVELTMDQLSNIDSTYTFVDRVDRVVREGDKPRIRDFSVTDPDGNSATDKLLSMEKVFLLIAYDLTKTNRKVQGIVNDFASLSEQEKIPFIGITAASMADAEKFRHEAGAAYPYYFADGTVLKTMIRSNPGLMLLSHGTVKAMWHHSDLPSFDEVKKQYLAE